MCGAYSTSYNKTEQTVCVVNPMCRQYGFTVVPYGNNGNYANFEQQYRDMEQDMCNSVKRWGVTIEHSNRSSDGSDTYYVRFDHKDKSKTDQLTRSFDTFEQALDFANKTYKELK